MSYERGGSGGSFILPYAVGLILGIAIGNIGHIGDADKNRDTQLANEQIRGELEQAHQVGRLVLDPDHMTFSFNTHDQNGTPETCSGAYQGKGEAAHLQSDLKCEQTVPAVPHS
ncbi:MAG TPA: hypothetical protein VLF40_03100 [Candidatus Saccharimonadales bacterium]|nr:hypothetical protein [Candidatus Saccharimonadales bacterium]